MPLRNWIESLNNAINGILHAAKTERHLRYHLYSAATVVLASFILGLSLNEFIIITILAAIVILAEMMNTAVEHTVDLLSPERREKAKLAKDAAAGAVLITAFTAATIGYIILFPYIKRVFDEGIHIVKYRPESIVIVSVIIVFIMVILMKTAFGRGKPLYGGLPSGHAALAFCVWVSVTIVTKSFIASVLSFVLAVIIAQSRVTVKAHTPGEVVLGALVGSIITFFLFYLFS